ncbi:MAG: hypothetical protein ABSG43_10520, partial [Solirubrobacteraceae bacterium]
MRRLRRTRQAGDLLPVSTVTDEGLAVLDDCTLVRAVEVSAIAPLRMSSEQLGRAGAAVAQLAAQLPDRQSLTLITQAEPLDSASVVDDIHDGARQTSRALERAGRGDRGRALEALALTTASGVVEHAQRIFAMSLRHLLLVSWRPERYTLRKRRITPGPLEQAVQDHDAHLASVTAQLVAMELSPRLLDGRELLALLDRQLNPDAPADSSDVDLDGLLGPLDQDAPAAAVNAGRLRAVLCRSRVDDSARSHLVVGDTAVHGRAVSSVPDHTWLGWLFHLMQSPYPFTLAVHWR